MTQEYVTLFNAITDTIETMESLVEKLKAIQCDTEESIISQGE